MHLITKTDSIIVVNACIAMVTNLLISDNVSPCDIGFGIRAVIGPTATFFLLTSP